jgi:recombination protein RecA
MDAKKKALAVEKARLDKKYGHGTGAVGSDEVKFDVYPTGILSLDYALGTGGYGRGYCIEVFGPEDIGKSSAIGLSAIRGAQSKNALCGIIAVEPNWDKEWAARNGVDPELIVISRPDTGEEAFDILYDWVMGDLIDFVLFDSIGGLLKSTEIDTGKQDKRAKPSAGGQSPLVTWGVKRCVMPAWKLKKTIMYINQVRDKMDSQYSLFETPGGHAIKHSSSTRIQIKPKTNYTATIDDTRGVVYGRELIAEVARNKLAEGSRQRALFNYYQMDYDGFEVGIDIADDLIRVGKKTGVLEGSSWIHHDLFPEDKKGEHKLQGKAKVKEWMEANPKDYEKLREEILTVMVERKGLPNLEPEPNGGPDEQGV